MERTLARRLHVFGRPDRRFLVSLTTQSRITSPMKAEDRPAATLADVEEHLLACCRALLYANPFMAFGNAMLTGFVMSRLRRNQRRG
jgi:hypothetical protein